MFSLFRQTEHEAVVSETAKASFSAELLKKLALGGGMSTGAAVAWGAWEVMRDNPHDAFSLLRLWGPWAVVTLVAIYVVYDIIKLLIGTAKRGVIAMEGVAVALQQIAGKDDRQLQELQTLTAYTAQESDRSSQAVRELSAKLDTVALQIQNMLGILSSRSGEKLQ